MLMVTTSTSTNNTPHFHPKADLLHADCFEENDSFFYETLRKELDTLQRDPSDEVIDRILAYGKAK